MELSFSNEYTGFRWTLGWTPDRIPLSSITPKEFFERYVATRTPVVFTTHIDDPEWQQGWWSDIRQLKEKAGHETVQVERRAPNGRFGTSLPRQEMKFADFLDMLQSGDTEHYLTTQYQKDDKDAKGGIGSLEWIEDTIPPPLVSLVGDTFPLRPRCLGNLAVSQVNLWLGANKNEGTSSGLHHDFHDNLYLLIRGRKRFTIFAPSDAAYMYTEGTIARVHANGLINYAGAETRADGVPFSESRLYELEQAAQRAQAAVEALADRGVSDKELRRAEKAAERAMATLLREQERLEAEHAAAEHPRGDTEPPSFSRVDVRLLREPRWPPTAAAKAAGVPRLASATPAVVDIAEGEMLYLPASYFHEVCSFGEPAHDDDPAGYVHMAFNYWLHPPTERNFEQPYPDGYWASRWDELQMAVEARKRGGRPADELGSNAGDSDSGEDEEEKELLRALWQEEEEEEGNEESNGLSLFGEEMLQDSEDERKRSFVVVTPRPSKEKTNKKRDKKKRRREQGSQQSKAQKAKRRKVL